MDNILVFAPHPDDETLGCGGYLLKQKQAGHQISLALLTNIGVEYGWSNDLVERKQLEIEKISGSYGFKQTLKLDLPETRLESMPFLEIIDKVSAVVKQIKPNIILLPNRSDVHTDHQILFKAIYSCTKNFRYPFIEKILMYETLSETEFAPAVPENAFIPNVYVDVTPYFEEKLKIMQIFENEIMADNLPRSISAIRSLGGYRGSRIGVKYAEAFMLLFSKE